MISWLALEIIRTTLAADQSLREGVRRGGSLGSDLSEYEIASGALGCEVWVMPS